MPKRLLLLLSLTLLAAWPVFAEDAEEDPAEPGEVFDRVVAVLERWYHDKDFVKETLPGLVETWRDKAHGAPDPKAERAVITSLLSEIPASHLALISMNAYHTMGAELFGNTYATFGLQLVKSEGRYFATWVYEGGPAALAGVKRGDEVVSLDGVPPAQSERLDWTTDDAALPDLALHALLAETGDALRLELRRERGSRELLKVELEAVEYSGALAAESSARVIEVDGQRFGYVHFWLIPTRTPSELLKRLLLEDFADCDGLVLDLRGRGGSATEVSRMRKLLEPDEGTWGRPLVALTDRRTRSAKEVIALRIQEGGYGTVVGERTAGAVLPAAFREVGGGAVLMFPAMKLGRLSDDLEGIGVTPDVLAEDSLPYTAGADPILAAGLEVLESACRAPATVSDEAR